MSLPTTIFVVDMSKKIKVPFKGDTFFTVDINRRIRVPFKRHTFPLSIGKIVAAYNYRTRLFLYTPHPLELGKGRISGVVSRKTESGTQPSPSTIRLYRESDGELMKETRTSPNEGSYSFRRLSAEDTYSVVAYDTLGLFNGVIATKVTPVVDS